MKNVDLLILSGGKGSRMGYVNKWNLLINEDTFLKRIIKNYSEFESDIYVVAKKNIDIKNEKVKIIKEESKEYAAIIGIVTAFEKTKSSAFFVIGCDMPYISKNVYLKLLKSLRGRDAIALKNEEYIYTLGAIYTRKLYPNLKKMILNREYSLKKVFQNEKTELINIKETEICDREFININTKFDYEEYILKEKK